MLKKVIIAVAGLAIVAAAGCANKAPKPPVNSGTYSAHPYHGGKTGKL